MKNPKLFALLTIGLWSFGMYLGRLMAINSQFILLDLSFIFAFIVLLVYTVATQGFSFVKNGKIKPLYFLVSPLGYLVYCVGVNQSSRAYNSISETTILNYTWVIFTIIFTEAIFNRKRQRERNIQIIEGIGIILGFLAVVLLATRGNFSSLQINLPGLLWGLLAGVSYGLFSAYSSTVEENAQGSFLLAGIFTSIVLISIPSLTELEILKTLTWQNIGVAFASGGLLSGLGYIFWTRANRLARLQDVDISSVASLMLVLPFTSLVVINLLLGESSLLEPYFLVSLVLILISSLICQKAADISCLINKKKKP